MKALEFYQVVSGLSLPASELGKKEIRNAKQREKATKYVGEVVKLLALVNNKKDSNKPFLVKDLRELMTSISNTRIALKNLKGIVDDKMIENNSKQIAEIEKAIALIDVTKKMTLTEAINNTEINNVELWGDAQSTGGNSSARSRIAVTNTKNERINGYFTSETALFDENVTKKIDAYFKAAMEKYPRNSAIKNMYNKLKSTDYGLFTLVDCMNDQDTENRLKRATADTANVGSCYVEYKMRQYGLLGSRTDIDRLGRNSELKELLINLRATFDNADVVMKRRNFYQYGSHKGVGIKAMVGSSKSGRNVAVSNVANILGVPHLVAKAVPVTVNNNGKLVRGVFMQQAAGLDFDLDNPERTDFMRLNNESLDGDVLKQIADLQVLDFICQNVDRHFKNMLYTIDRNRDVSIIQGIDNDLSFGTVKPVNTLTVQNGTSLNDITVITETMAETIKKLQPETLASVLADTGLKQEEIAAACERLTMLKAHIEKHPNKGRNIKPGKVKIPTEKDWIRFTCGELAGARTHARSRKTDLQKLDNLFNRANDMLNNSLRVKRNIYGGRTQAYNTAKAYNFGQQVVQEEFKETQKTNVLSLESVARNNNTLAQLADEFKVYREAENKNTPGSAELQKALLEVINFKYEPEYENVNPVKELRTDRENEEVRAAEERMRWKFHGALINLKQIAEEYVNNNIESVAYDSNIKDQVNKAKEILENASRNEETFREATLQQQEDELEEIHLQLIKEQHQFDSIVGALAIAISDKLAPMDCNDAIDKILDGPIIKILMDKDEALEKYSNLAENDSATLYKTYAELVASMEKEDFKDDMHKALHDKVLADNAKKEENEEPEMVEENEEAMAEKDTIGKRPEYTSLTNGFTESINEIKNTANAIKDGKMDKMLLARYIANRIALAEVEELSSKEVDDVTLSELKKYENKADQMYDNTVKLINEKSEFIDSVLEKFANTKNLGDALEKMYTAYATEVIDHKKPEKAVDQNAKKIDNQNEVKTDVKKEEVKAAQSSLVK